MSHLAAVQGLLDYGFVVGNLRSGMSYGFAALLAFGRENLALVLVVLLAGLLLWARSGAGARSS